MPLGEPAEVYDSGLTREAHVAIRSADDRMLGRPWWPIHDRIRDARLPWIDDVGESSDPFELLDALDRLAAAYARARPAWMRRGACAGRSDVAWFPQRGQPTAPAKAICDRCPVETDCRDYAMSHGIDFGVWGGLSAAERRRIRRA